MYEANKAQPLPDDRLAEVLGKFIEDDKTDADRTPRRQVQQLSEETGLVDEKAGTWADLVKATGLERKNKGR